MNLTVIGEGIETPEQLEFLQNHGCDLGQGYYYSVPLDHQQVQKLFTKTAHKVPEIV